MVDVAGRIADSSSDCLSDIALVVIVGRSGRTPAHFSDEDQRNNSENALGILAERFARGEINDEENQQKKNALKNL